jgi:hypothetical protein
MGSARDIGGWQRWLENCRRWRRPATMAGDGLLTTKDRKRATIGQTTWAKKWAKKRPTSNAKWANNGQKMSPTMGIK